MSASSVQPPSHLPRTFLEWGVAVPFTTPLLGSGRVRPGRRGRPEMILPNPSGGRGLYVFDLAAAPEVASLTLHDRLLLERLLALPAVTPSEIRKAAHAVAIEGAAGRKAARVAVEAAAADQTMGLLTRFHLVTHLLEEAGLERIDWRGFTGDDRELRAMIKGHLAQVAPKLDTPGRRPVRADRGDRRHRDAGRAADRGQRVAQRRDARPAADAGAVPAPVVGRRERRSPPPTPRRCSRSPSGPCARPSAAQQRARDAAGERDGPAARLAAAGRRPAARLS